MELKTLRRKPDWLAHDAPAWCRTQWPRIESLNWFIKKNRARLVAEGAAVRLSGGREWFICVERFPIVAAEVLGLPLQLPRKAGEARHV